MKRTILAVLFVTIAATASAQTTARLGQDVDFAWDYTDAQIAAGSVARFEVQVDTNPRINSGLPVLPPGTYLYPIPKAQMPIGDHTVKVWACNATECSETPAQVTFTVLPLAPVTPTNPRVIVHPTQVVSIQEARQMADAFSYLLRLRTLTTYEVNALVNNYAGPLPLTYGSVIEYLNTVALSLVP